MDGIAGVQARIAEIQSRFVTLNSASSAASATSSPEFAEALQSAQRADGSAGASATSNAAPGSGSGTAEQQVVNTAKKYLGIPYVWGGTNPKVGLDCSGLTQRIFKDLGYDIPRVSYEQAKAGRAVGSLSQARPGDLVFYDYSSSRPGIDHVGVYIGDGKIINAPKPGDVVKIADVGNPVAIRRILPEAQSAPSPTTALASAGAARASGALADLPYGDLFAKAGARHGIPSALLAAVAKTESGFNPNAVSPAGAQGLMQFMPATAKSMGINPLNPAQAVDGAARYLSQNLRAFGSIDLALAAYNAGPGAVRKYGGIPPYSETQNYVRKVNQAWESYR